MSSPFQRVKDIYTRGSSFDDEGYVQYIINKELSKNPLLIPLINEIQQYTITNEQHFTIVNAFAPLTRRPGFKQFPWIWKGGDKVDTDAEIVAKHYKESIDNARDRIKVLKEIGNEAHLEALRKMYGNANIENVEKAKNL